MPKVLRSPAATTPSVARRSISGFTCVPPTAQQRNLSIARVSWVVSVKASYTRTKPDSGGLAHRAAVASNFHRIADAVAAAPDVDTAKVEAIKEALACGEYEIDPDRIARKMLGLDKALGRDRRRSGA